MDAPLEALSLDVSVGGAELDGFVLRPGKRPQIAGENAARGGCRTYRAGEAAQFDPAVRSVDVDRGTGRDGDPQCESEVFPRAKGAGGCYPARDHEGLRILFPLELDDQSLQRRSRRFPGRRAGGPTYFDLDIGTEMLLYAHGAAVQSHDKFGNPRPDDRF